jgi:hypothetical protein
MIVALPALAESETGRKEAQPSYAESPGGSKSAPAIPYAGGPFGGFNCNAAEQAVLDHPRCRQWLESYRKWRAAQDTHQSNSEGG